MAAAREIGRRWAIEFVAEAIYAIEAVGCHSYRGVRG